MPSNFLTANIAGLESMQEGEVVYGYQYNRIVAVLNGLNPLPLTTGTVTLSGGGLNMPGPLILTNNPGAIFAQGTGTAFFVGGTTGFQLMNNINSLANMSMTDLGVMTVRAGFTLTAGDITLAGNINGQTISSAANFTGSMTVATTITSGLINGQTISSTANLTGTLVVGSTLTFAAHVLSTAAGTPSTSALGANITSVTFTGNDTCGIITIVVAAGGLAANTRIATCTFANTYGATAPKVRLTNETSGAGLAVVNFYKQAFSTGVSFDLACNQALAVGTYIAGYTVIG